MNSPRLGWTGNLILGLLGGLFGGWVFDLLAGHVPQGIWRHAGVSLLGSILALAVARRLKPVARQGRKGLGGAAVLADVEPVMGKLGRLERTALDRVLAGGRHRDPNASFEEQVTFGDRIADPVSRFGGSWTFIGLFLLGMLIWMILNTELHRPFDAYPFIFLNLCLSCVAAQQALIIMMSQNQQAQKDRLMTSNDYAVNVRSEMQLQTPHVRFDELREKEGTELVAMQQRQIELLERIVRERQRLISG